MYETKPIRGQLRATLPSKDQLPIEKRPSMISCKKFPKCSAPQCPLDVHSLTAPYLSGESICPWLLEYGKGNHAQLSTAIGDIPIEVIEHAYSKLFATYGTIRNRLERAKDTPSRLTQSKRVKSCVSN
jgi:hypothetical protein